MASATMYFPGDFLWGMLSAAHLGQRAGSDSDWEETKPLGEQKELALDAWGIEEMRLETAAGLSNNAYRLSLDWSRIEPEPSRFDAAVLERYRALLARAREMGLQPVVTLHHFTNPRWLVEKGDFSSNLAVDYFSRYASRAVSALGDQVHMWLTFNEPLLYLINRYLGKGLPEAAERGWSAIRRAYRWLLTSHAAAYQAMKSAEPAIQIGVAKHYRHFLTGTDANFLDRWQARGLARRLNFSWWVSLSSGRMSRPFGRGAIPGLAGSFDFIGISYYVAEEVGFSLRPGKIAKSYKPITAGAKYGHEQTSPEGLYQALKSAVPYNKPIVVTANGLPRGAGGISLPSYVLTHLREVWRAISFSFPVMGYFLDPFAGGTTRAWQPDTPSGQEDTPIEKGWEKSPVGQLYGEICATNGFGTDMADRYAPSLVEVMFPGRSPEPKA